MADFNQVLTPGDYENGEITVVVEIPQGSSHKIEWDRKVGVMKLDRVEPAIFAKPTNYGFIPQTLDEDGDELDVLLITDAPLTTGIVVNARIVGVMKFEDDGEVDDKIICAPADDRDAGDWFKSIDDYSVLKNKLEHHFTHYKDLKKPGSTKVLGWGNADEAKKIIKQCIMRYNNK